MGKKRVTFLQGLGAGTQEAVNYKVMLSCSFWCPQVPECWGTLVVTLMWPSSAGDFPAVLGHQSTPCGLGGGVRVKMEMKKGKESFQHLLDLTRSAHGGVKEQADGIMSREHEEKDIGSSSVPANLLSPTACLHQPQHAVFSVIHCLSSVLQLPKVLSKSILYHHCACTVLGHPPEVEP